jgi:hypothetical protein
MLEPSVTSKCSDTDITWKTKKSMKEDTLVPELSLIIEEDVITTLED